MHLGTYLKCLSEFYTSEMWITKIDLMWKDCREIARHKPGVIALVMGPADRLRQLQQSQNELDPGSKTPAATFQNLVWSPPKRAKAVICCSNDDGFIMTCSKIPCRCNIQVSTYFWSYTVYVAPPPLAPLSLLLLFSNRLCRFSSLSRASSSSCCWRHLWKFSTTTPTNMFSTKKLTMRRKEMKNSSIHGLLFLFGCREIEGRRQRGDKNGKKRGGPKSEERGWGGVERRKRREHKQEDNVNPESAVKLQALSTHIYSSVCLLLSLHLPSLRKYFPFLFEANKINAAWDWHKTEP